MVRVASYAAATQQKRSLLHPACSGIEHQTLRHGGQWLYHVEN